MLLLLLAAAPAFAESIYVVDEPCKAELPDDLYDKPFCADYELNSALIVAAETGDRSALAMLEQRYWTTEQYQERHRIGGVLLSNLVNDSAIWNDLFADAQLAVHFADVEDEVFEQWCDEHGFYWLQHRALLFEALAVVASDPRSRPLLVKALSVDHRDIAQGAVYGLLDQRDLASLPAIDQVLARYPDDAPYIARGLAFFEDERADAIAKKYLPEEEEEPAAEEEEEEVEEQETTIDP